MKPLVHYEATSKFLMFNKKDKNTLNIQQRKMFRSTVKKNREGERDEFENKNLW